MGTQPDRLYLHFERHLFAADHVLGESHDEFIRGVVADYWAELQSQGPVATPHSDEILKDLEDEVRDMLHKKIYGFFSLRHYREWITKKGT